MEVATQDIITSFGIVAGTFVLMVTVIQASYHPVFKLVVLLGLSYLFAGSFWVQTSMQDLEKHAEFYQQHYPIINVEHTCPTYDEQWAEQIVKPSGRKEFCSNFNRVCNL